MTDYVAVLAKIAREVEEEATRNKVTNWHGTPLEIMKKVSNSVVGKTGEVFNARLFEECSYYVEEHTVRGEYDLRVGETRVEVKTATMDTQGSFQFNGIRLDRHYDVLSLLGIAPDRIYFRFYRKSEIDPNDMVLITKNIEGNYKWLIKPTQLWNVSQFCDMAGRYFQ